MDQFEDSNLSNLKNRGRHSINNPDELNYEKDHRHHTLGQIAEKVAAKARADAMAKGAEVEENFEDDDLDDDDDNLANGANINEQTGRWTSQEHKLFLEALKKYGKVTIIIFSV